MVLIISMDQAKGLVQPGRTYAAVAAGEELPAITIENEIVRVEGAPHAPGSHDDQGGGCGLPLRGERHPGRPEAGEIGTQAEGLIVGAVRGEASAAEDVEKLIEGEPGVAFPHVGKLCHDLGARNGSHVHECPLSN